MLTKNTFNCKERLINIVAMGLKSVELKASSQHYKDSFRLINLDLSTFYEDKLRLIFLRKEK